jgi:hypothetical protein
MPVGYNTDRAVLVPCHLCYVRLGLAELARADAREKSASSYPTQAMVCDRYAIAQTKVGDARKFVFGNVSGVCRFSHSRPDCEVTATPFCECRNNAAVLSLHRTFERPSDEHA